ncbi:hypothetical protein [Microbispora sp. KK1-11]|uniref:hypothetical protein n=1 Tax=Microbispora sp. KK1-11 TaxID=2053005 RepID=UPI00115ACB4B|nr:hypothetical protein [Microbispora sp. KK1-11]TQS22037.1 hypothetical protein FLW16_38575 [Microbispora sp. KK1-11]
MLKSKARGRVAGRAAAAGVVSAGLLLGLSALGARADTKTVTYTCTPGTGGTGVTHDFTVTLTASTSAVSGTQYTATLSIAPVTTGAAFTAPVAIASGAAMELQPVVSASALPAGMTAGVSTPSPTGAALTASVAAGGAMPTLPTATLTVTPSTGATSVVLTAKDFKIGMIAPAGTGTTTTPTTLYNCVVATTGSTLPAVATIPVTSASASPSASASASASPSASASASPTPRNTRTVYETVFASPTPAKTKKTKSSQVENTPGGGAATGGGGDAGPDARLFVLTGTALMLAAGAGGLVLRARRRPVRQ